MSRANHKIDRAIEHVNDLHDAIEDFRRTNPYPFVADPHSPVGQTDYYLRGEPAEFPPRISAIFSDALVNLRSALDFIFCEHAQAHSGHSCEQGAFGFPIVKYRSKYVLPAAKGVPESIHPAAAWAIENNRPWLIDDMNPPVGDNPHLWFLHEFSNIAKHRFMLNVSFAPNIQLPDQEVTANGKTMLIKVPGWTLRGSANTQVNEKAFYISGSPESNKNVAVTFDVVIGESGMFEGEPVLRFLALPLALLRILSKDLSSGS